MLLPIVRVRKNWYIWREHCFGTIASGCIVTIAIIKAHIIIRDFRQAYWTTIYVVYKGAVWNRPFNCRTTRSIGKGSAIRIRRTLFAIKRVSLLRISVSSSIKRPALLVEYSNVLRVVEIEVVSDQVKFEDVLI